MSLPNPLAPLAKIKNTAFGVVRGTASLGRSVVGGVTSQVTGKAGSGGHGDAGSAQAAKPAPTASSKPSAVRADGPGNKVQGDPVAPGSPTSRNRTAKKAAGNEAAGTKAPGNKAPGKGVAAKKAAAKKASAEGKAPAKKVPAKKVPAKTTPPQKAPSAKIPTQPGSTPPAQPAQPATLDTPTAATPAPPAPASPEVEPIVVPGPQDVQAARESSPADVAKKIAKKPPATKAAPAPGTAGDDSLSEQGQSGAEQNPG